MSEGTFSDVAARTFVTSGSGPHCSKHRLLNEHVTVLAKVFSNTLIFLLQKM